MAPDLRTDGAPFLGTAVVTMVSNALARASFDATALIVSPLSYMGVSLSW